MPTIAISPPAAGAAPASRRRTHSFAWKGACAIGLVAIGDWLFANGHGGSILGVYALLLLAALLATRPATLRSRAALAAAGTAALFAFALGDDPSLLAAALFWVAVTMAALLPRTRFDTGLRWTIRLLCHLVLSVPQPLRDWGLIRSARHRLGALPWSRRLPILILPVLGSVVFVTLFASANPLIEDALGGIEGASFFGGVSPLRLLLWAALFLLVWSLLRPAIQQLAPAEGFNEDLRLPGVSLASVTLSLFAFNAIFALQNGLDIAFLWSGAALPEAMTLAEYAHRGAYPLIATALLAGLFVLVTTRPGSDMAKSKLVRRLVTVWIAQNVLLVASTMLRTLDYVEVYSLTRLRIAALLWMALVAIGLVLICYRLWRERSGAWLINANMAAAALLLTGCAFADLGAVAASWNVRHTRDAGGGGAALDLCFLNDLGASALLPLIELESRRLTPQMRDRIAWSRNAQMEVLEARQADWRNWTFRGARRLAEAKALVAERRLPRAKALPRNCDAVLPDPPLTAPRQG
jgi:hypothetical protein